MLRGETGGLEEPMGGQRRRTRRRRAAAGRNQTAVPGDLGRAEKLLRGLVAIKCGLVTTA